MKSIISLFILMCINISLILGQDRNIMQIPQIEVNRGDTITVPVEVLNDNVFVAFQVDISFPDGVKFIDESHRINENRRNGHNLIGSIVAENKLRVISFAMPTKPFFKKEGPIFYFDIKILSEEDEYELELSNALLSSDRGTSIYVETINGVLKTKKVNEEDENVEVVVDIEENVSILQAKYAVSKIEKRSNVIIHTLNVDGDVVSDAFILDEQPKNIFNATILGLIVLFMLTLVVILLYKKNGI